MAALTVGLLGQGPYDGRTQLILAALRDRAVGLPAAGSRFSPRTSPSLSGAGARRTRTCSGG
jgi:hypothetical protein